MILKTKINIPTKLRKPPTFLMSPEGHRRRAEVIRQEGGPEWIAEQHEMVARVIEVAIVKRGARVREGS